MKLRIREISVDGHNGHVTAHFHVEEEKDGQWVQGAVETHGIDPIALQRRFKGDVQEWLKYVGRVMKENHIRRTAIHAKMVHHLKGEAIDLGD